MNEGAIVMMDCLGYKGIWERADADKVLEQFLQIEKIAARSLEEGVLGHYKTLGIRYRLSFLSDTVVVGADAPGVAQLPLPDKGRLMHAACVVAQKIASDLLRMAPPLAVRGCACYGRFDMTRNFIIGPAVDEVAELHELADGAFLWVPPQYEQLIFDHQQATAHVWQQKGESTDWLKMLPLIMQTYGGPIGATDFGQKLAGISQSEKEELLQFFKAMAANPDSYWDMVKYEVPLKGKGQLQCLAMNPRVPGSTYENVIRQYNIAMRGSSVDVIIKRQNTLRFLDYVHSRARAAEARCPERIKELTKRLFKS